MHFALLSLLVKMISQRFIFLQFDALDVLLFNRVGLFLGKSWKHLIITVTIVRFRQWKLYFVGLNGMKTSILFTVMLI